MEVYIEYAFLVNFLLDGLLLYLALKAARAAVSPFRLAIAAILGAGEAILFPLFSVPDPFAYILKIAGGLILAVVAVKRGTLRTYLMTCAAFFAMTFLLGGILTSLYSFFSISYAQDAGYLMESAPIALVLAVSGIFAIFGLKGIKAAYRYCSFKRKIISCILIVGDQTRAVKGLVDSGNCLSFRNKPVCVISPVCALALFRTQTPVGRMTISTVSGKRDSPVFEGKILMENLEKSCYFTVGEISSKEYQMIVHIDLLEGAHERFTGTEGMAEEVRGR